MATQKKTEQAAGTKPASAKTAAKKATATKKPATTKAAAEKAGTTKKTAATKKAADTKKAAAAKGEAAAKTSAKKAGQAATEATVKKTVGKSSANKEAEQTPAGQKPEQAMAAATADAAAQPAAAKPAKPAMKKKAPTKRVLAKIIKDDDDGTRIVVDSSVAKEEYASYALGSQVVLDALMNSLMGEERRVRQFSASIVALVSRVDPSLLVPVAPSLVDALSRPEAQTRWEVLAALYNLVPGALEQVTPAIIEAGISLYDEDSGQVRLAAFRFLCKIGACDLALSAQVWPDINEAIQCYHGDLEFQEMLDELVLYAQGTIDATVKKELAARMKFDSTNGKGPLKRKAEIIVKACG